jgi:hypothetical protein
MLPEFIDIAINKVVPTMSHGQHGYLGFSFETYLHNDYEK